MTHLSHHHDTFTLERTYEAPRAEVWRAWSRPEQKSVWMGARDLEMDFRPGGTERSSFSDERGVHTNEGRYFEIEPESRIVLAYAMAMNGRVHTVSLATVVFLDEEAGTRVRYTEQMCVIPPSDGSQGRQQGWSVLLDRLALQLEGPVADTVADG